MPLDIIEPQELARSRHIERAVVYRDAIGLIEAAGDQHHPVGLVIAVAIDDCVHLAGPHRSDEHGALRTQRHLARVLDAVREHGDVESRGDHPLRLLCQTCSDDKERQRSHDLPLTHW